MSEEQLDIYLSHKRICNSVTTVKSLLVASNVSSTWLTRKAGVGVVTADHVLVDWHPENIIFLKHYNNDSFTEHSD